MKKNKMKINLENVNVEIAESISKEIVLLSTILYFEDGETNVNISYEEFLSKEVNLETIEYAKTLLLKEKILFSKTEKGESFIFVFGEVKKNKYGFTASLSSEFKVFSKLLIRL